MSGVLVLVVWLLGMGLLVTGVQRLLVRQRSRDRIFAEVEAEPAAPSEEEFGFLARWLFLAGYRKPQAPTLFLVAALCLGGFGLFLSITLSSSPLMRNLARGLERFPGNIGQVFLPFVYAGPWLAGIIFGSLPWLVVRRARRERVTAIEQDLPLFLELLATLGEAGLGFDAALARILDAQTDDRPLVQELRTFQVEVLAGRPRIQVLRRLARRVDVTTFTIFISALVQAEQSGAGIAGVLRRQAEDARDRRRERTLQLAAALPVKLLFPLIICFLPGIFVAALGPVVWQFFQFIDAVTRGARGGG
jgi:pilus assembly protein TadC